MGRHRKDITGQKFGKLTAIRSHIEVSLGKHIGYVDVIVIQINI